LWRRKMLAYAPEANNQQSITNNKYLFFIIQYRKFFKIQSFQSLFIYRQRNRIDDTRILVFADLETRFGNIYCSNYSADRLWTAFHVLIFFTYHHTVNRLTLHIPPEILNCSLIKAKNNQP
jgi:hypothetical protein